MSNNTKDKKSSRGSSSAEDTTGRNVLLVTSITALFTFLGVAVKSGFENFDKISPNIPTQIQPGSPNINSPNPVPAQSPAISISPSIRPTQPIAQSPTPIQPVVQSPTPIQPTVTPIQPTPSVSTQPSTVPSAAEITQPSEGEIVERNLVVSGRFTGLANGDSIWLYVRPSVEKRYYPLKVSYDSNNKSWQVPIIVGSVAKEESGALFEIGVFVATPQNNEILVNGGENGLSKLPSDIVTMKSVNVRRK